MRRVFGEKPVPRSRGDIPPAILVNEGPADEFRQFPGIIEIAHPGAGLKEVGGVCPRIGNRECAGGGSMRLPRTGIHTVNRRE